MSPAVAPYPLVIEPLERASIWGGGALAARYGKPAPQGATIGESWECWDGNRVRNGAFAGATLGELRAELGAELLGHLDVAQPFPLLTKLIDARDALSVQVHPDDAYARRVERRPVGKTECWCILEAEAGARIVLGWNRAMSRAEYLERVADASLGDVLRYVDVRPGDVFFLPAGTMHAIGGGIVLFEVQQASDLTYRIYDYDRRGPDGRPRELHVQKAADVLDYRAATSGPVKPITYALHGLQRTCLVAQRSFVLERIAADGTARGVDLDNAPLAITALDAPIELAVRAATVRLEPYETAVVPAAAEVVTIAAPDGRGQAFFASPPADAGAIERRFSRAAVPIAESTAFLAQF